MTLSRQLIALISAVFFLVFSGTLWISVNNTRSYLMLQLATQTQNAADALGLSLVPYMQKKDIAAMDTMVNAVFDSGYYKSLKLTTMSGKALIGRENSTHVEGVPSWFIHHLSLQTPIAKSIITTGWRQAGQLTLVADPGFAYKKLWDTTIQTLRWSALTFILSLIAALIILKSILRPLDAVEKQALAICDREFVILDKIPRSRELKRVVIAMNLMSGRLQSFITKLTERAEKMRKQAYYDELTDLMNRRGFYDSLDNALKDRERDGAGTLALIRIAGFAEYNRLNGHLAGDDMLTDVATRLTQVCKSRPGAILSRIGGSEFAIILPWTDEKQVTELATDCSHALDDLNESIRVDAIGHIGITTFKKGDKVAEILANVDAAQAKAQHIGPNKSYIQHDHHEVSGNFAWKDLVLNALSRRHIHFLIQPVLNPQKRIVYHEVLFRIRDNEDNDVSPGTFASMAERLQLHRQVDQFVIESILGKLDQHAQSPLAVNLSFRSIQDTGFIRWLEHILQSHPDASNLLLFEVAEHGLIQAGSAAVSFIELAHSYGVKVVMEHFGISLNSFQTLRKLKLDFIKLDGSYIQNLESDSENRFFLQTIIDIAHGLDIQVIAEQIETENDSHAIIDLGINAMQGYYFGKPTSL